MEKQKVDPGKGIRSASRGREMALVSRVVRKFICSDTRIKS